MPEPLHVLVSRANQAYGNRPGYRGCYIENEHERLIRHELATDTHADLFRDELVAGGATAATPNSRPSVVLQTV
jgi:hypothetical protein